jgi:hypothetical protein
LWTYPANEAVNVPRALAISIQFDRFLMPMTAVRASLCLQPATVGAEHPGTDRCVAAGFAPQYDPVDRVATWVVRGELMPLTRYNVRLFAPTDPQDQTGVRAFDGAPLAKETTFAFTTTCDPKLEHDAAAPDAAAPDAAAPGIDPATRTPCPASRLDPPRTHGFCATKTLCPVPATVCDGPAPVAVTTTPHDLFANTCTGGANCHGGGNARGVSGAALRFDDDGKGGGLYGAMRRLVSDAVVANETATGIDPAAAGRNPLTAFGRNMPYIDATNPANSYLLYKMILALPPRCPVEPNEESATHNSIACDPDGPFAKWRYAQDHADCWRVAAVYADAGVARDPSGACPSDAAFPELPKRGKKGDLIAPLHESRVPDDAWQPPAKGEYDRLRQRIRGAGMPEGSLISRADALAISAWIVDGASVESCDPEP